MKRMFTQKLCIYMIIALITTVAVIFLFQTYITHKDNTANSEEKLLMVKEKLKDNDEQIQDLLKNISENSLAKARAFAVMIKDNPSILDNQSELTDICSLLEVDEVHVTDEKGVLWWGSVESYYGFDFNDGDQTRPFLKILEDPKYELAQEPQPNATMGIYFQYIGVARIDKPGIVQVGLRPEVLEHMLENTEISRVLSMFEVGETGCIFAINENNGSILAYKNNDLIGKNYTEAGFPQDILKNHEGSAKIDGVSGYYITDKYNDIILGTFYPQNEYYSARTRQLLIICISMFIVFAALILLINRLVSSKIVKGIHNITHNLSKITDGNLDIVINEKGNPEFNLLSSSINSMVQSIKTNIDENKKLLEKQKHDMSESLMLVDKVKSTCGSIDNISQDTLSIASSIHASSEEQTTAVRQLSDVMSELVDELKKSAKISLNISDSSMLSASEMEKTSIEMNELYKSIEEIASTTSKIQTIIENIDDIASQTNMLALNASIEAARAGEQGKGFAVVASQVGELAAKSTKAAKETANLITDSMNAVEKGERIAQNALQEFLKVAQDVKESAGSIGNLTNMSNRQVDTVMKAVKGLHKISDLAEKNAASSLESENTSSDLAEEAKKLRDIIGM